MVDHKTLPKLEAANRFRHGLFQCFFETDISVRAEALKALGHVVEFWTHSWLEFQYRMPSPRSARPSIARQSSSGSGVSITPGSLLLRRDSSFKMQFDDIFAADGDDVFNAGARRKDSAASGIQLTPDRDDGGWPSLAGEYAISPSDASFPFADQDGKFSNNGIGTIDTAVWEVNWAGSIVAEEIWGVEEMRVNLENFYIWLLRFSVDCPFKDVRKGCEDVLKRAEKSGAQLPIIPHIGPSVFVPLCDTVGLEYPEQSWTPVTPSGKSHSPLDTPSEEDEDGFNFSPRDSFPAGIMIPPSKGSKYGDRQRSRSRGRAPVGGSIGRTTRRTTVSLVSTLFQTPPSPTSGMTSSHKIKRRANQRRPAPKFLPKAKEPSEDVRNLQMQTYAHTGRVGNMNKILFVFPRFAGVCRQVTDLFLSNDSMDGPLPQVWRIYLGIIAAAEKRCQYYISLLSEKFLTVQGPVEWLNGIQFCPPKLQRIAKLNMSLAHLPWTISADDISWLVRVDDNGLELRWSVSEVMQAILVLSFYHGKSAMALGWGILPEADLLGGTVKTSTPVAPFGSFASLSTNTPSELAPSVKAISELESLGIKGNDRISIGLLNRKRESGAREDRGVDKLPEKWRKTPTGSVPYSLTPVSIAEATSPVDVPSPSLRNVDLLSTESVGARRARHNNQKRRKSFEECGTSDDPLNLFSNYSATSLSSSAPNSNSYIIYSATPGSKPLPTLKDHVLSPSSSTSSIFEAASLSEQAPINVIVDDYAKFICTESLELKAEQLDPNRDNCEFLPMEEFDWDRNATCIIGSYLESCVDLLDEYFKEALDAEIEDDGLFASVKPDSSEQPRKFKQASFAPSLNDTIGHERMSRDFGPEARAGSMHSIHSHTSGTRSVKEAAWYYSLRLLNIQKDDFRYSDIKYLLDKPTRRYLKRICLQPEMVSASDVPLGLGLSVCLLACQARFLGEVLWGIKAVGEFLC